MYCSNKMLHSAFLVILLNFSFMAKAQTQQTQDIWYVWIDTDVTIDGTIYRVISDKPILITCCIKSAKYRKLVKKSSKWIKDNISKTYDGKLELMKLQDRQLAEKIVSDIQLGNTPSVHPLKIVKYRFRCHTLSK